MRKPLPSLCMVIVAGLVPAAAFGADAPLSHLRQTDGRVQLAVLDLDAQGVDPGHAQALTGVIAAAARGLGAQVQAGPTLAARLDPPQRRQLQGCADLSCMVEIATAAGVDYLLAGSLAEVGGVAVFACELVDIDRATAVARRSVAWKGDRGELRRLVQAQTHRVLSPPGAPAATGAVRLRVEPPDATVFLDGERLSPWQLGQPRILEAGAHHFKVVRHDYLTHERSFVVMPDERSELSAELVARQSHAIMGLPRD